jgi:hypothetical protein
MNTRVAWSPLREERRCNTATPMRALTQHICEREDAMNSGNNDGLRAIAAQVADCFSAHGYAFVEDDKIDGLASTLASFLTVAGIPINGADPMASVNLGSGTAETVST